MARQPTANSILRREKQKFEPKSQIASDMYLPNDSQVRGADSKLKIKGFTDGSVLFAKDGKIDEDNSNFFWDDTNKRLGTGIANPLAPIHIFNSVNEKLRLEDSEASGGSNNWMSFYSSSGRDGYFGFASSDDFLMVNQLSDGKILLGAGGNNPGQVTIDKDGNVGIGTISPDALLHVKAGEVAGAIDANTKLLVENDDHAQIELKTPTNKTGSFFFSDTVQGRGRFEYSHAADTFRFYTAGTQKVAINSVGKTALTFASSSATSDFLQMINSTSSAGARPGFVWRNEAGSLDNVRMSAKSGSGHTNSQFFIEVADSSKTLQDRFTIDKDGNTGIGTIVPTQPLSVKEKSGMTAIGGICIKLTNKTGANSVAGQLVKADTATDDAVILTARSDDEGFGVFLEGGVSDGSEAWVVVGGIADVMFGDNIAAVRGNWVATGSAIGDEGTARTSTTPNAAPQHFEEFGHCIESVAAGGEGTNILARCVLHFN